MITILSCFVLIIQIMLSFTDHVDGVRYWHDCAVPQGRPAVICLGVDEGNLTSSDIPAHVGDTVYGKCMVTGDFETKYVYVTHSQKPGELHIITSTILNDRNVSFTLTNVTDVHWGSYECRYNFSNMTNNMLDNTFLYIGRYPLQPKVVLENTVIFNWMNVSLPLSPSYQDQRSHVVIGKGYLFDLDWKMKYSLSQSGPFHECDSPSIQPIVCQFSWDHFNESMTLFLEVKLENEVDELVTILEIGNLNDRVKPAPVSNIKVTKDSSTTIFVSWTPPNEDFSIIYSIALTASNVQHEVFFNVTNETQFHVKGLVPHGIYNITVTAKPLHGGIVSEQAFFRHEMKPDVPGRDPVLIPGGFDSINTGQKQRNVTIYWQPVPEQFSNGEIDYMVVLSKDQSAVFVDGTFSSLTLSMLADDLPQTVYLYATNKDRNIGRNISLPGTPVEILAEDEVPALSDIAHERNETHKLMTWKLKKDDVSVYVVGCKRRSSGEGCDEKVPLSFSPVNYGQTSKVTSVDMRAGVGIIQNGKQMGIFWSELHAQAPTLLPPDTNHGPLLTMAIVPFAVIAIFVMIWLTIRRIREKIPITKLKTPPSKLGSIDEEEIFFGEHTNSENDQPTNSDPKAVNEVSFSDDVSSNSTDTEDLPQWMFDSIGGEKEAVFLGATNKEHTYYAITSADRKNEVPLDPTQFRIAGQVHTFGEDVGQVNVATALSVISEEHLGRSEEVDNETMFYAGPDVSARKVAEVAKSNNPNAVENSDGIESFELASLDDDYRPMKICRRDGQNIRGSAEQVDASRTFCLHQTKGAETKIKDYVKISFRNIQGSCKRKGPTDA